MSQHINPTPKQTDINSLNGNFVLRSGNISTSPTTGIIPSFSYNRYGHIMVIDGYFRATTDVTISKSGRTVIATLPYKPLHRIVGIGMCDSTQSFTGLKLLVSIETNGDITIDQPASFAMQNNNYVSFTSPVIYYTDDIS